MAHNHYATSIRVILGMKFVISLMFEGAVAAEYIPDNIYIYRQGELWRAHQTAGAYLARKNIHNVFHVSRYYKNCLLPWQWLHLNRSVLLFRRLIKTKLYVIKNKGNNLSICLMAIDIFFKYFYCYSRLKYRI